MPRRQRLGNGRVQQHAGLESVRNVQEEFVHVRRDVRALAELRLIEAPRKRGG